VNRSSLRWWLPGTALAVVAAGEWLRAPTGPWLLLTALGCVAVSTGLRAGGSWRHQALAGSALLLALAPLVTAWRLHRLETQWPAIQQAQVDRATDRLSGDLHAAYLLASQLADRAVASPQDQAAAFDALADAVRGAGVEAGVALLGSDGRPWAWAGAHRLAPRGEGRPVATVDNPFYLVLEVARDAPMGRRAVGSVVIWASAAVPERVRSVTEDFRARTGVGLRVYPAGTAPDLTSVFDYTEPTTAGPRLLFSVEPLPPALGDATAAARAAGAAATAGMLLLVLLFAVAAAGEPATRYGLLLLGVAVLARAPVGQSLGFDLFFSPIAFFRPALGPLSESAGALAVLALVLTLLSVALWNHPPRRRWFSIPLAIVLMLGSPVVLRYLARGITPPPQGASLGLWLGWELTLAMAAMAPIVLAAAVLRGETARRVGALFTWVGITFAVFAAATGLYAWRPGTGWESWYVLLWLPALLLVTRPARRGAAIAGIGAVAGSAAALLTWATMVESRLEMAQQDAMRLGLTVDPVMVPLLERAGTVLGAAPAPRDAPQLFTRWFQARKGLEQYPVRLALRGPDAGLRVEVPLDSLDLPDSVVTRVARAAAGPGGAAVTSVPGVPGVYQVLALRLETGDILTVVMGPRTRLLTPDRLGALLGPADPAAPAYRMVLSPPVPGMAPDTRRLKWRREGWVVHGERTVQAADGVHEAHAEVDLRGPFPILVRGALVVILDAGLLAALWLLAEGIGGRPLPLPEWRRAGRSFRVRVALALAGFFLIPAVGFAVWEVARLNDEADSQRDDAITQVLRDVAAAAGENRTDSLPPPGALDQLGVRFGAELARYRGGGQVAATDSLLAALSVLPPLQDPEVFQSQAFGGEMESAADEPLLGRGGRIGYRVEQVGGPAQIVVLAAPHGGNSTGLEATQADIGWLLLLSTLLGLAAALSAARIAAEALARPVADLRRAALAVGRGAPPPAPSQAPPAEFEPVVAAFERMAADIRQSQAALEESRRRTASVLATVATGVVGIGPGGAVLVANPRAEELLGRSLGEGTDFAHALGEAWPALVASVQQFLAHPGASPTRSELEDGARRLSAALAPLGPEIGGAVLALNDITELSRAERVLAWGEMARQVAHEIKNPLTPIRLGIQHLRRVRREHPAALGEALGETSDRILAEIERLDTIARAFSRFAAPAGEAPPPDRLDLGAVAAEVVQLYRLAGEGTEVAIELSGPATGRARADEVKEVLVNLLENSRQAGARRTVVRVAERRITVQDDGRGIPEELLPRVFEPRFSTTTSGSGLGLAIVKRLVEGWGAAIHVESTEGQGTTVTIVLA
jgi:two-component system, NtrC family, nitrogen regulation sensor histidine kinase NtrY